MLSTMIIWFTFMWCVDWTEAAPASLVDCAGALCFLFLFGLGIGLLTSAMQRRFTLWWYIYGKLTYHLAFLSGVMTVVDVVPLQFRDILVLNPITHAIEWFRIGLYGHYPHATFDMEYLVNCTCFVLMLGVLAHRTTLRIERY
jgi:capsular polysaccharide transport system permease protein